MTRSNKYKRWDGIPTHDTSDFGMPAEVHLYHATAPSLPSAYFWHVSDFHLDTNYSSSSEARSSKGSREYFLGEYNYDFCWSDQNEEKGPYGDYQCDAPMQLIESAINFMSEYTVEDGSIEFLIWTG